MKIRAIGTSYKKRKTRSLLKICLAGFLLGLLITPEANAQNYQNIAPQAPPPGPAGTITPPPQTETDKANDKIIIPSLKGVKFIDNTQKVSASALSFEGLQEDGVPHLLNDKDMHVKLEDFLKKPLTFNQMQSISKLIIGWYREHDHPFVDVVFPEQDLSTGVLQVLVEEFRVGHISVTGNQWFSADQILSGLRVNSGDLINSRELKEDLAWINQNPFRSTDAFFEKGDEEGKTNLDLKTEDQFPLRVYAGYDNSGTPLVGRSRYNLGANWGNAFWANQLVSYQFTTSSNFWVQHGSFLEDPDNASFVAHSLDDVIPLPWHDKIDIFGAYTSEKPQLISPFNQSGHSGQASVRYIHTLPVLGWLSQEVHAGYDFKTSNNNLEFGGAQVYASSADVDQFLLIYKGSENDTLGQTTFKNTFVYSPGGLTANNTTTAFRQSGATYANGEYVYDNIDATRSIPFFLETSAVTRVAGQVSSGNLLPSEELGAGGEDSVRGYNPETALGSNGILLSEELRLPSFSMSQFLFGADKGDIAQFLTFWDYGRVANNKTQPLQPSNTQLSSVGLGVRYTLGNNFSLKADYGWQLIPLPNTQNTGSLAEVSLTASY